jgi:hypothetical protein
MNDSDLSRRQFLGRAGRLAASGAAAQALARVAPEARAGTPQTQPASRPANATAIGPESGTSQVVQVRSDDVVRENVIRIDMLTQMLTRSICRLTGQARIEDAWHSILRPDDVIGIKFNRVAAAALRTTPLFARVLVRSLVGAGFSPNKIIMIEGPESLQEQLGTAPPPIGWSAKEVDFGSGKDRFALVLERITALINVPFLKSHNIAGMSGCLKNLSHALVRSPGKYHANRCSPFIADIVAADLIRSRLRLHLVNALRAVFDKGPTASFETTWPAGTIIASFDPVAADTVGLEMLNHQRDAHSLPALDDDDQPIPSLHDAQRRGLGTTSWDRIRQVKIRL